MDFGRFTQGGARVLADCHVADCHLAHGHRSLCPGLFSFGLSALSVGASLPRLLRLRLVRVGHEFVMSPSRNPRLLTPALSSFEEEREKICGDD